MKATQLLLVVPLLFIHVYASAEEPASPATSTAQAESKAPESSEKIRRWIEQLDSDEYWTREDASKRLFHAGAAAIGPLSDAARSKKLEVSTRAVGVLARLLELEDPQVELAAETALEDIAASRVTSAASRAEAALDGYRGSRQERVLARFRQLGAAVATTSYSTGDVARVEVTIGEGWRGTTDDLAALKRIPSLQELRVYEGSVKDDAVKHFLPLKQLTTLELFGTGISDEGVERLKTSLVGTTVDRRKGGLLGVMGSREGQGGGCLISGVQPGSAAAAAGLQPGDVITKFEGQPVDDFPSLTQLIATKGAGETVELELERQTEVGDRVEKQRLTKKATLDRWKTRPVLNMNFNESDVEIIIGR